LNLAVAAAIVLLLFASPAPALAQHEQTSAAPAPAEGHGEGEHGTPLVDTVARLFNFAILAGTLVYFLKSPLARHLADRGAQIRGDLVKAAEMRAAAAAQLAAIEQKMAALPGELDALRKTGAEEAAAEEARIRQIADGERARLREQARREIDSRLKLARRDLVARTADLAVAIAAARVKHTITAQDQERLVDRYLAGLAAAPAADRRGTA
jgi:F-type H+-transporting ATPase subunit b